MACQPHEIGIARALKGEFHGILVAEQILHRIDKHGKRVFLGRSRHSKRLFNLGYLPGGDHSVYTRAESTIAAVTAGLDILKRGGLMCVTIYSGGANGYAERDALIPFFASLDDKKYQVLSLSFHNWKKDPPLPFFIIKN